MHYKYYAMIFWILFKPFFLNPSSSNTILADKANRGVGAALLQPSGCRSQVPHFALIHPQGSSPYLLLVEVQTSHVTSLTLLGDWRVISPGGMKVQNPHYVFFDTTHRRVEVSLYSLARVKP